MPDAEREFFVVDAFTTKAFSGNAAAVLPDGAGLSDAMMSAIAAEFNLSETTFILPVDEDDRGRADVRFRWFTPQMEVDLCGHATIAGVHALVACGRVDEPADENRSVEVRLATRSGVLSAYVERIPGSADRMIWFDLIPAALDDLVIDRVRLSAALGVEADAFDEALPPERTPEGLGVVFVRDMIVLHEARPAFERLGAMLKDAGLWGLSLATVRTVTPSVHVQSRFFAPPAGVNEDPVTGSVHGPLGAYLVKHGRVAPVDGLAAVNGIQGVPGGRTGMVHVLVQPRRDGRFDVRIGGQAVTVMRGTLLMPVGSEHD